MTRDLAKELSEAASAENHVLSFDLQPLPGETEVLRVTVEDKDELPVFISYTQEQILCIVYLATTEEIDPDRLDEMHEAMLSANVAMPLSAFAKIDGRYVLYGALSVNSSLDDIVHEISVLSDNSVEALSALRPFIR